MKKSNTVGSGANTTLNGLEFERGTDLAEAFIEHPLYKLNGDGVVERTTGREVGCLYGKNKLYKNLLEANSIAYQSIVSKKLLPDDALLVGKTLFVIEKKYQAGAGSVDEKLQTCDFKRKQYTKLLAPLGIAVITMCSIALGSATHPTATCSTILSRSDAVTFLISFL